MPFKFSLSQVLEITYAFILIKKDIEMMLSSVPFNHLFVKLTNK